VDRLNIIAHDKFQEIIDEANKPDSAIHLQQVILNNDQILQKTVTVVFNRSSPINWYSTRANNFKYASPAGKREAAIQLAPGTKGRANNVRGN